MPKGSKREEESKDGRDGGRKEGWKEGSQKKWGGGGKEIMKEGGRILSCHTFKRCLTSK